MQRPDISNHEMTRLDMKGMVNIFMMEELSENSKMLVVVKEVFDLNNLNLINYQKTILDALDSVKSKSKGKV